MSQVDKLNYIPLLFWFLLIFLLIYFIIFTLIIPLLHSVSRVRVFFFTELCFLVTKPVFLLYNMWYYKFILETTLFSNFVVSITNYYLLSGQVLVKTW